MKFSGKIKLGNIKVQVPETEETIEMDDIEIEYSEECDLNEAKGVIEIVKQLPDVFAEVGRKCRQLSKEFQAEAKKEDQQKNNK